MLGAVLVASAAAWARSGAPRLVRQPPSEVRAAGPQRPAKAVTADATHRRHAKRRLRLAVIGDFGDGTNAQMRLAREMCRWRRHHRFSVAVAVGDNVYPDGSKRYFRTRFFKPYSCLRKYGVRWHSVLGNHDIMSRNGRPELKTRAFGMKARNYVLRRGHVRLVFADSNNMKYGWLRRATRARHGDRWTIVVFHHPVYSAGKHFPTPGFLPRLPKLFQRRGVDLVLNGHDHLYFESRRLHFIRYVVTGGGGGDLMPCRPRSFTKVCESRTHFLYVQANPRKIRVRAIDARGRVFARFRTSGSR